jgi:iron complex outermembrane receptor protein
MLDKDYYEMLTGVGANTGIFVGFLGDPRTFGVTLRTSLAVTDPNV